MSNLTVNNTNYYLQQDDGYKWNGINRWSSDWSEADTEPQTYDTYGLSRRPDLSQPAQPTPWQEPRPPSANPQPPPSGFNFNRYAAYDPVTRRRTTAVDRNCTASGCCVPKCFAEKGHRVCVFYKICDHKINIINTESCSA